MPYSDYNDSIEYNHYWYLMHRNEQINKMTKYYYDNRSKILKQHKIKYKQSKKTKKYSWFKKSVFNYFLIYNI
jgi:hypothetical protein